MPRYNRIKTIILEYLREQKEDMTTENIYMGLRKNNSDITLAIVGKNLVELCEEGIIIKYKSRTGGPEKYNATSLPHITFECEKCGELIDIYLYDIQIKRLDNEVKKLAAEVESSVNSCIISMSGKCKKCKEVERRDRQNGRDN